MNAIKAGLIAIFMAAPLSAAPYFEGSAGYIGSGNMQGETVGVRMGRVLNGVDYSFGYTRASTELDAERIVSNGLDLHTLSMEAYKSLYLSGRFAMKLGGGLGYSIPSLSGPEKADSGVSFIVGGGAEYSLGEHLSLSTMVRGQFFRTDTRRIANNSHTETLSTGQEVEVLDLDYIGRQLNLDSILVTVGAKYYF